MRTPLQQPQATQPAALAACPYRALSLRSGLVLLLAEAAALSQLALATSGGAQSVSASGVAEEIARPVHVIGHGVSTEHVWCTVHHACMACRTSELVQPATSSIAA